ncbi:hypothetical protein MKK75_06810 [Methylobacterium sp. J-030]|uniref:hypothetical protein n=1 Tax=Methylobacterium sp. J-030 TaxID=2836627 RepID=UPI001FBAC778|nr:hypothetical protein [Methylobacterium sp. J-030]MCJ2068516.1 hypothetical protein [Methylobacterium sp. J-030]
MPAKQTPSLDGLIQAKGAPRPSDVPQRGEASRPAAPAPTPAAAPAAPPACAPRLQSDAEPRTKSLTLRLSEPRYQRLRRFAFDRDASHQEVIEAALMAYLERETG